MRSLSIVCLITMVMFAAAFRPEPNKKTFAELDKDTNGQLDDVEVDAHLSTEFEREAAAFMDFFDVAPKDGSVTKAEFFAKSKTFFHTDVNTETWFWASIDRDKSGVTDVDELRTERSLFLTGTAQEVARQWLRKHDADSNSKISKEEFLSFSENSEAVFNIMDKNGDGIAEAREFLQTGGIGGKPTIWIKHQDTDLDGMVSEAEYLNTHAEL